MASNDWERHKATILNLYLLERTPLHEVVSYMQQKHDFAKKESQYQYQFKKWGVRKNSRKKDWQHLRHQLQKRIGKQSEVTLFGFPLSAGKVRKETQRYAAIPTANEFGRKVPSPEVYDGMMVRAQSPSIVEDIMWPPLPWFHFKNIILPTLRHPSNLLKILFNSLSSNNNFVQYQGNNAFSLLYKNSRNPLELREVILHLSNVMPDDSRDTRQKAEATEQKELPLLMATEILKLVFFHLSNNIRPGYNTQDEAVYGSAIREKNYMIVSRLLDLVWILTFQ
ncbi:hypothetical protein E0Z10_g3781 [Xylaria hypoxylon]|uniref:Clr5 domain-containing protein n=1 Tax=Xylaria hypoxylon TaxID=37992 RepID=A0A4Z0YM80_9PEZI|nr:hypothetical protein E0Z10_g3781 [Xylaria hypoxylon]